MRISCAFDDSPHHLLYSGSIRRILKQLLPPDFFFSEEPEELDLPAFKWTVGERYLTLFLLFRHRTNGVKFFYEMITRWLVPGKRTEIVSFFSTDFQLLDVSDEALTIAEAVIPLEDLQLSQMPIFESEVRLGLSSVYHANRILEIKGLSADEKTARVQERIISLLKRRPKDFDHDIFLQMQHFLVMCSEEFKAVRESAHLSRIISVFYLFGKALKRKIESAHAERTVVVKLSKTHLHLSFGRKKVIGVFLALNLQGDNELFEERHLLQVLKNHFPQLNVIEGSCFSRKEDGTRLLYIEVEGAVFDTEKFAEEVRNGIEKLAHPVFMPRNEEEVMRNIITLSNQLKMQQDLPQVVITFDEQTAEEVFFTVVWLRVVKADACPLQEMFENFDSIFKFVPDRIKEVGTIRKKYRKEATVFRLKFEAGHFLRSDHSVDLFKARQAIVLHLKKVFGDFRDYNGGMIAKQHEHYDALRGLFSTMERSEELLLEKFFHSIYPIEMRSLFDLEKLKKLFTMLLNAVKSKEALRKEVDETCAYILMASKEKLDLQIPTFQMLMVSIEVSETFYLGLIHPLEDENLTFEPQTVKLVGHEK